jgi:hypothetical protein
MAVAGMVGGQAFGQNAPTVAGPIVVRDAPIHKIPNEEPAAPAAEPNAPPNTLNAQYAALARPQKVALQPAPALPAPQSRAEEEDEGPSAAIAPAIIDAAGAFEAYMRRAGALDGKFADGAAIGKAVATGSGYEIAQFQEGMVAYAALAALQEADFVQAVYDLGRDAREREALAQALVAEPKAVLGIDGAGAAAVTVSGILSTMGAELVRSGTGVRKAAYDVQKQAWSKEAAPDPQGRLAETKKISAAKTSMSDSDTEALIKTIVALRKAGPAVGGRAPAPTPVVQKGLALAALAVLGKAGEEDMARIQPLLDDAKSEDCMKMAKLNLYQCLAVAGPHYEHAYCLGQHALMDTGQCVISAAGQSPIPTDAPIKPAQPKVRSVSVPMALGSPAGPERSRAYARLPAGAVAEASPVPEPAPPPREEAAPAVVARDERLPDEAPPPREAPRDEAYAREDGYRDDAYARDDDGYREPARPRRQAEADRYDDRYDPRYDDRYDDRGYAWRNRQDYDPYASGPPAYAYRFGR